MKSLEELRIERDYKETNIRLPRLLLDEFDRIAKEERVSRNKLLQVAISDFIVNYTKNKNSLRSVKNAGKI